MLSFFHKETIFVIVFFLLTGVSKARHTPPLKFGKYKKNEIELKEVSYEPDAEAVMIYKYGNTQYKYGSIKIKKHIRIKILKEKGIENANVRIPYYSKGGYEKVNKVKAQTANYINGKKEEIEVDKDNIFDVDINEHYSEVRFTFPDVKVGSIIEYEYTVSSESYLTLDEWSFQSDIPVLHSEIFVGIPDWLDYQMVYSGHKMIEKYKDNPTNNWVLKNLRSLKEVPYLYNLEDYAEKIMFQLSGYQHRTTMRGTSYEKVMKTWDQFADDLLTSYKYKNFLNRSKIADEILTDLDLQGKDLKEKVTLIFDYVRTNYSWNNEYHRTPEQKIQDFYETKRGNSASVNLLLTLLLNEAGLVAKPALISTRSHGAITKSYPLLTQFSHVLSYVELDEEDYLLLDAIHSFGSVNYLPAEDLNYEAFVLDKQSPEWVKIKSYEKNRETVMVKTKINEKAPATIDVSIMSDGLNALETRTEIYNSDADSWLADNVGVMIKPNEDNCEVENFKNTAHHLKIHKSLMSAFNTGAEMLYINPYFFSKLKNNPFKLSNRYYPVEFEYPYNFRYIQYMELPDGYEVVEIPESERVRMPNGYGYFQYAIEQKGKNVNLSVNFMLNAVRIPATNYDALREFYDIVASKLTQQVVLKKLP